MAVYKEVPLLSYFPYLGALRLLISTHEIVIIDKPMGSGRACELRIDTGEGTCDWSETYMQITNPGEPGQGIHVMYKGFNMPDFPVISAGDYYFHNHL